MSQVHEQDKQKEKTVKVEVSYLPATEEFEERYEREAPLSTVRTEAMEHFGVQNYTDRDTHEFFLELDGTRITDYSVTLEGLLGKKPKKAEFDLVEQVTAGGS
ncbi:MAG: hypothetical protein ACRDNB_00860 [Gaiellaceae bacterium]